MIPLTKDSVKQIVEERRRNSANLAACVGPHEFFRVDPDKLVSRYRCNKCGGIVEASCAVWYNAGILHGKGAR